MSSGQSASHPSKQTLSGLYATSCSTQRGFSDLRRREFGPREQTAKIDGGDSGETLASKNDAFPLYSVIIEGLTKEINVGFEESDGKKGATSPGIQTLLGRWPTTAIGADIWTCEASRCSAVKLILHCSTRSFIQSSGLVSCEYRGLKRRAVYALYSLPTNNAVFRRQKSKEKQNGILRTWSIIVIVSL